jgi:hypothetical protein
MLKQPVEYESDSSLEKFTAFFCQVSPTSLPGVSVGYCHVLVDESGIIRAQMGNAQ